MAKRVEDEAYPQLAGPLLKTRDDCQEEVGVVSRGRDGMDCKMDTVGGAPFRVRGLIIANPAPP